MSVSFIAYGLCFWNISYKITGHVDPSWTYKAREAVEMKVNDDTAAERCSLSENQKVPYNVIALQCQRQQLQHRL